MNDKELIGKVHSSMYHQLKKRGYATAVDVLMDLEILSKVNYERWRNGQVPYLEKVCNINLKKLSTILHEMRGVKAKNLDGKEVKDFSNKELIVLYTEATTSLPPIATPDKIVVLESVDLATYKEGSDKGVYLRKYYEAVGAKVEWNQADKSTKISLNDKSVSLKNMSGELYIEIGRAHV